MKKKKISVFVTIIFLILICAFFILNHKSNKVTYDCLFEDSANTCNILVLYKNDKQSGLRLTTNMDSTSPMVYFDVIYERIVESDNTYYLTNNKDFLKINKDGTFEKSDPVVYNDIDYAVINVDDTNDFDASLRYIQPNDNTEVYVSSSIFKNNSMITKEIAQVDNYFN